MRALCCAQPFETSGEEGEGRSEEHGRERGRRLQQRSACFSGLAELSCYLESHFALLVELQELTCVPLPYPGQNAILEALKANPTIVILGETGSGKTTRTSLRRHYRGSQLTFVALQRSPNSCSTPQFPALALASKIGRAHV